MLRRETAANPDLLAAALKGLRAYQEAPRPTPIEPRPAIAEAFGATVRDYGGEGAPVLFVPSLINPPSVLDLTPERSLLRWLAGKGHRVLLLDWGTDIDARRDLSISGHVEQILLPFIRGIGEPVSLAGYCLGGTMAIAAASATPVRRLALIAAPWHFSAYPVESRARLKQLASGAEPLMQALGLLPMEVLQTGFWSLDPKRAVSKFQHFGRLDPGSAEAANFVALEDWANDGPPLPSAAARELFNACFAHDLPGNGRWEVEGKAVDPSTLYLPILNIISDTDNIVPRDTGLTAGNRIQLQQGHVGMVVGRRSETILWNDLTAFLL